MSNIYCGLRILPEGKVYGNRLQCFQRGMRTGMAIGHAQEALQTQEKVRTATERAAAISSALTKRQLAQQIQKEGIAVLKQHLELSKLNKDLVRSIAIRLTGTAQAIPYYSRMTLEQLKDALVERGFRR